MFWNALGAILVRTGTASIITFLFSEASYVVCFVVLFVCENTEL